MGRNVKWEYMTAAEIGSLAASNATAIVPIGSMEQHGPHLPVNTDSLITETVACMTAEAMQQRGTGVVVLPTVWLGNSLHHMDFAGTLSLDYSAFEQVLLQICRCLQSHGFRRVVLLNGHGGNHHPLNVALTKINLELGFAVFGIDYWNAASREIAALLDDQPGIKHAGEAETSLMLAIAPEFVKPWEDAAGPDRPDPCELTSGTFYTFRTVCSRSALGVSGSARRAAAEKGRKMLAVITDSLAELLVRQSLWDISL